MVAVGSCWLRLPSLWEDDLTDAPARDPRPHEEEENRVTDRVIRLAFLGLFAWWSVELILPFLGLAIGP